MGACYFSTIAQLVERMTVNHDVTGSSPVGGVWIEVYSNVQNRNLTLNVQVDGAICTATIVNIKYSSEKNNFIISSDVFSVCLHLMFFIF